MALRDIYARTTDTYARQPRERAAIGAAYNPGFLGILWRRKILILAIILLSLGIGAAYIIVTPSRYLATAVILIDPRLGKTVGTDPVTPGFIPDSGAIDSQIKLFTSQTVLARVAKLANLGEDPEFDGSERSLIDRILRPNPLLVGKVDLKALEDAITVKRPERTYVVQIDVLARGNEKSAEIANDIVQAYIDDQISSRVDSARDDSQFVREKLDKLSTQIRDADERIEAYKTTNNIVDANGLRSNEQQVADLLRSLSGAQAKTSDAKARLAEITRLARSGHLDAASQALDSQTIQRLRQQQAEADESLAKLASTLGPRHPELLEAESRAAKAKRLIRDELERVRIAAQANYQADSADQSQILAQVDTLKAQSNQMGQKLVPLEQLQRNASVLRSSFQRFSQVNDNLAQQEGDSPPGRIISVARPSVSPARPKKSLTMLIASAAGLFLGVAAALFVEGSEPGPATPRDVYEPVEPPPAPRPRGSRRYWDDDDDARA